MSAEDTGLWEALSDSQAAHKIAADAADRFRDVISECLDLAENPGDDALVAAIRERFGKSGPEPTRWRDFLVGAEAMRDQILAEHQPTAREACTCGYGGFHEPLNKRCAAYDPTHPDVTQPTAREGGPRRMCEPAPVAPAGGRLSEEEPCLCSSHLRGMGVPSPAIDLIVARLAAAEQRVTEAKAEALREAADVGLAEAYGAGAIDNDAARWLRARAADIRREATGEGGGA